MKAAYVLLALVAAAAVQQAAAAKVPDYQQCGGTNCKSSKGKECEDAPWEGSECVGKKSKCVRNSEAHWMCAPPGYNAGGSGESVEEEPVEVLPWTGKKTKLPNYQQCGGKGGQCDDDGAVCADTAWPGFECEASSACTRNTDYNWQCKPKTEGQQTALTDKDGQAALDVSSEGIIPRWKQCGGASGACDKFNGCDDCKFPGTFCEEGYVCARVVESFWQCVPSDMGVAGPKCKTDNDPFVGSAAKKTVEFDGAKCGPKAVDMEIDGTYLDSVALSTTTPFHECCDACSKATGCKAFQVNAFGNGTDTCDFFSVVKSMVAASGSTAALIVDTPGSVTKNILATAGRKL
jgi:hypothetical protein